MKKIIRNKTIHKSAGFTLVEMIVTVALSAVAYLGAHQFFSTVNKETESSRADLEKVLLNMHTNKILRMDFSKSKYSLNNLYFKDNNGHEFFDYLQDGLCSQTQCKRIFSLPIPTVENVYGKSFFVLIEDTRAGHQLLYNPVDAYESAVPNSTSFVSLNRNDILKNRDKTPWKKDKLIYMYSPTPVRNPSDIPGKDPYRVLSYLGWLELGTGHELLQKEEVLNAAIKSYRPLDPRDNSLIQSEDDFLRSLPFTSGLGTFVIINAAKVIRYRMKAVRKKGILVGELHRGVKNRNGSYDERIAGFNIKKLNFYRDDISFPTIGIDLEIFSNLDIKHEKN